MVPASLGRDVLSWVIFDRVIERSLQIDVRFDPDSDRCRTALQYVAKGHKRTHAPHKFRKE
jgi:hypothetical protein